LSKKFLIAENYPDTARQVIKEMHRQVGDLAFNENGLAMRGILMRHLVMPNAAKDARDIMRYLAKEISPHTLINIMPQYHPVWKVSANKYPEINRPTTPEEVEETIKIARQEGLYRFDTRKSLFKVLLEN